MQKQVANTPYVYDKEIASGNGGENSQLKKEQGKQAVENIKENYIHSKTESFLSNFYYYPKYNNNSHNIKLGLNFTSLNIKFIFS